MASDHIQECPIYLAPHVRRYVLHTLQARRHRPDGRSLWNDIQQALRARLLVGVAAGDERAGGQRLVLYVRPRAGVAPEVSVWLHRYVVAAANRHFLQAMYRAVDTATARGRTITQGLLLFRARYGITEDDHSLDTARRLATNHRSRRTVHRSFRRSRRREKFAA